MGKNKPIRYKYPIFSKNHPITSVTRHYVHYELLVIFQVIGILYAWLKYSALMLGLPVYVYNKQTAFYTHITHHIKCRFLERKPKASGTFVSRSPARKLSKVNPPMESEQVPTVPHNAYHIGGDFRSGRWRQLRVMDRPGSRLLIRFTNCLSLRHESVSCNG